MLSGGATTRRLGELPYGNGTSKGAREAFANHNFLIRVNVDLASASRSPSLGEDKGRALWQYQRGPDEMDGLDLEIWMMRSMSSEGFELPLLNLPNRQTARRGVIASGTGQRHPLGGCDFLALGTNVGLRGT